LTLAYILLKVDCLVDRTGETVNQIVLKLNDDFISDLKDRYSGFN